MRPDRFGQSQGKEFIESRGREREGGFLGDHSDYPRINALAFAYGFTKYSNAPFELSRDHEIYPRCRIVDTYEVSGLTHEVLIYTSGDVAPLLLPGGDFTTQYLWTEVSGAKEPTPLGAAPIECTASSELSWTLRSPGFCTSVATLEGTPLPVQHWLEVLYSLHIPLSDFDDPYWRMVRDFVGGLSLVRAGGGDAFSTPASGVSMGKGSSFIFGQPVDVGSIGISLGAMATSMSLSMAKTLMPNVADGFSDWIIKKQLRDEVGGGPAYIFGSKRCNHSVGVEVLQQPPVDMTGEWFTTPQFGNSFGSGGQNVQLRRYALPLISPPPPHILNTETGTLPHCTA